MGDVADLEALAELSPAPECARLALRRLAETWPAEEQAWPELIDHFKDRGEALVHLLAISPVSVTRLIADPGALVWLSRHEIHDASRTMREMRLTFAETRSNTFDERFQSLRRWKGRENALSIRVRDDGGDRTSTICE